MANANANAGRVRTGVMSAATGNVAAQSVGMARGTQDEFDYERLAVATTLSVVGGVGLEAAAAWNVSPLVSSAVSSVTLQGAALFVRDIIKSPGETSENLTCTAEY